MSNFCELFVANFLAPPLLVWAPLSVALRAFLRAATAFRSNAVLWSVHGRAEHTSYPESAFRCGLCRRRSACIQRHRRGQLICTSHFLAGRCESWILHCIALLDWCLNKYINIISRHTLFCMHIYYMYSLKKKVRVCHFYCIFSRVNIHIKTPGLRACSRL